MAVAEMAAGRWIVLRECARCGKAHRIWARPLVNAPADRPLWGSCPVANQPLLLDLDGRSS
jgi:hypothetical protein